jgi:hypothetical protein
MKKMNACLMQLCKAAMATTTTPMAMQMPHARVAVATGGASASCSLQLKAKVVWLWSRNTGERGLSPPFPSPMPQQAWQLSHSTVRSWERERESPVIHLLLTINRARHLGPFHLHFHSSTS